jgi:hypothetical protein
VKGVRVMAIRTTAEFEWHGKEVWLDLLALSITTCLWK